VKFFVLALLGLAPLYGTARADSWAPYGERLEVAENGKHFLFDTRMGPPGEFVRIGKPKVDQPKQP
jgi:hypothetical protein